MRHLRVRPAVLAAIAMMAVLGAGGCGAITSIAVGERHPLKDVPAEFDLASDRLVIVPYAGTDVLFKDPGLTVEISRDLINEMLRNLGSKKVKTIIHPVEVERWQEATLEWPSMSLVDIGKTFRADTVLYVELERYSLTEEQSANLYRGHVRARIQVVRPGADHNPVYETTVETVCPKDAPVGVTSTTEQAVRTVTNLEFAAEVVSKFYARQVEVKGGGR